MCDRLVHRSAIVTIAGESYRLEESREAAARRAKKRGKPKVDAEAGGEARSSTLSSSSDAHLAEPCRTRAPVANGVPGPLPAAEALRRRRRAHPRVHVPTRSAPGRQRVEAVVGEDLRVDCGQHKPLDPRLRGEQAVERVSVMQGQLRDLVDVFERDGQ